MAVYPQVVISPDPNYLQSKSYSAQSDRKWFNDLALPGVRSTTSDFVLNLLGLMDIRVDGGVAWIPGLNVADQGMYRLYTTQQSTITVNTSHGSLPRVDQVILRVMDNAHDGSGFNEARVEVVPGTPTTGADLNNRTGATPLTSLGEASKNVLLLYDILVPAGSTVVTAGNTRDKRQPAAVGFGALPGNPPLLTVVQFQALRNFPDGYEVYVQVDASAGIIWHLRYNATSGSSYKWEVVGKQTELFAEIATQESPPSSFGNMTTVGPAVALPLPGDYDLSYGFEGVNAVAAGVAAMAPSGAGITVSATDDCIMQGWANTSEATVAGTLRHRRKTGLTQNTITMQYSSLGSTTHPVRNRWMKVAPIRVSQ